MRSFGLWALLGAVLALAAPSASTLARVPSGRRSQRSVFLSRTLTASCFPSGESDGYSKRPRQVESSGVACPSRVTHTRPARLRAAERLYRVLGPTGMIALTRLTGFLMVCIGVQFIIDGFNLFNSFTPTDADPLFEFGKVTAIHAPRRFRFGARYEF